VSCCCDWFLTLGPISANPARAIAGTVTDPTNARSRREVTLTFLDKGVTLGRLRRMRRLLPLRQPRSGSYQVEFRRGFQKYEQKALLSTQ